MNSSLWRPLFPQMHSLRALFGGLICVSALSATALAQSVAPYSVNCLPNGNEYGGSAPHAINSTGEVAGYGISGYFLYSNGAVTHINVSAENSGPTSGGVGINSSGTVVGTYTLTVNGSNGFHAFIYKNGTITDIGNLNPNGGSTYSSSGNAINDSGQVAGTFDGNNDTTGEDLFLYSNGTFRDLGTVPGATVTGFGVSGINSAGQIVGTLTNSNNTSNGFLYSNGSYQVLGSLYEANAINSAGQIVGTLGTTSPTSAALYSNGSVKSLGTLGGNSATANAINSTGEIVGWSLQSDNTIQNQHGFLYKNGTMMDLNSLVGGTLSHIQFAYAINDPGQILVSDGVSGLCILTPSQTPATDGPLPLWSYLLFGVGLAEIARRRLQRTTG